MMKNTTIIILSHILFFFLLSRCIDAESNGQQLTSHPKFSLVLRWDPSFTPIVAAISCSILFVIFFSIYVRYCSTAAQDTTITATATDTTGQCSSSTHKGIDSKLLNTFPIFIKQLIRLDDDNSVLECAVCLSEFDGHDLLRLLPTCNHVFHTECIDAWLGNHVTCPVCRSRLTPEHHHDEVVIVIPDEVSVGGDELLDDESSESRKEEFDLGERNRRCLGSIQPVTL